MTVRTPRARHLTIEGKDIAPLSAILMKPRQARACFVFAHGAGAGMSHLFMEQVAAGLYARGVATLRYQFPFMEKGSKRPTLPSSHIGRSVRPLPKRASDVAACHSSLAASRSADE